MPKDYYQILGVSRKATPEEIKKAYRKLTAEKHPDNPKNRDNPKAEAEFAEINEANGILSNATKRAEYDAELSGGSAGAPRTNAAPRPGPSAPGSRPQSGGARPAGAGANLGDLFGGAAAGMFGGIPNAGRTAQSGAAPASAPAADEIPFPITLEEAMQGAQKIHKVEARLRCPDCNGTGRTAKGQGGLSIGVTACPTCSGKGQVRRAENVLVNVPAGIGEGAKLRLKGKGAMDSRGQRGDLFLTVRIKKSEGVTVDGRDLTIEAAIPYTVLVLGGEATVETPAGERKIPVPAGTQSGQKLTIAGMGLPALSATKPAGDLFVKVKVDVPKSVGGPERKLLAELAKMRGESVKA